MPTLLFMPTVLVMPIKKAHLLTHFCHCLQPPQQQPPGVPTLTAMPIEKTFHGPPANGVLGCRHYQRKAQLVAPCCDKVG